MTVVSSIPLGSNLAFTKFLQKNPRIEKIVVENEIVTLKSTETLSK